MFPLAAFVVGMVASIAPAQQYEIWHVDGAAIGDNYASGEVVRFDDADADGVSDLLVGAPLSPNYGTVKLLSGATGAELWTMTASSLDAGIGYRIAKLGDLDGDGVSEFATLTMGARLLVVTGATQVILSTYVINSHWADVAGIADADGDGVRDFAFSDPQDSLSTGVVYVYSGQSFSLIRRLDGQVSRQEFGRTLRGVGDVDADGVDDFMVGASHSYSGSNHGRIWVYSGATLTRIWQRTGAPGDALGLDFAPAGDLDGDGYADVAVTAPAWNSAVGKVVVYSGRYGSFLRDVEGDQGGWFGLALNVGDDLLGDGEPDAKLITTGESSCRVGSGGRVVAFDAGTGTLLARIDGANGELFGNSFATLGDVDGDGLADIAVTSPCFDFQSNGLVRGRIATYGWRMAPRVESVTPSRGRFDALTPTTIRGAWFEHANGLAVNVGGIAATNVQIVDNRTLTCTTPTGPTGPSDVAVTTDLGTGSLAGGFNLTPALLLDGDFRIGGFVDAHYLVDPLDEILAIAGSPPPVAVPTPPFSEELNISPFNPLFFKVDQPTDELVVQFAIPNDPALSGQDVLLQALAGSALCGPGRSGAWTNCATLHIE